MRAGLTEKQLNMGHARALLALPTDEMRINTARQAVARRMSVREVERAVRRKLARSTEASKQQYAKAAHIIDLEQKLSSVLGTKVIIETRKGGKRGKIVIDFYSLDEFERITERMGLAAAEEA